MARFIRFVEIINKVSGIIGLIFLAAMMLLTVINIVMRRVGLPMEGVYSIVCMMAVVAVCAGIINAAFKNRHILLDLIGNKFPPSIQLAVKWIAGIIGICIWGLASWITTQYALEMWRRSETLDPPGLPVAPFRFIWALTLALFCLAILATLLGQPEKQKNSENPE